MILTFVAMLVFRHDKPMWNISTRHAANAVRRVYFSQTGCRVDRRRMKWELKSMAACSFLLP